MTARKGGAVDGGEIGDGEEVSAREAGREGIMKITDWNSRERVW